ncbi:IgaA/UmoB family intracellular growth attenuator [Serratia aquatilis]|uniref:IgaA/UmoB family intracellular growth attenuator n=1 Tax=Serratia aquatilis TaxID=1737515 RepID=A0ABV6EFJ8_9GAMM
MSTIALILVLVLACLLAASIYVWFKHRNKSALASSLTFIKPTHRKLTAEERTAIEYYLNRQNNWPGNKLLPRAPARPSAKLALTAQSDDVYPITHAITRYGLAGDAPNNWRYYLDSEEIHLPPFWEQYISADNHVEVIKTQTLPLVISLNGHSLLDHICNSPPSPLVPVTAAPRNAAIRKDESEHVELVNIRKETREEHALNGPNGVKEAAIISTALLLLFFSLISPVIVIPWMIFLAVLAIAWGCWSLFRRPVESELKEVHGLRGIPKRWELFGESNQEQDSNISLGTIDLIYPPHWQPYLSPDLGKMTNVDIYLNKQVIRHGRYLSLHDEVKNFPLQQWGKNAVLAANSLVVLLLVLTYIPLSLPVKLSSSWLQGTQRTEVSSVQALEALPLHIGDTLKIHGTGMCYVPSGNNPATIPSFMPFDCSAIYWNNSAPLPQPESEVINKATALQAAVNGQLHRSGNEQKLNPQLASAIEKSGMILLDDFSGIVLKTQDLCGTEADCIRLKNALTNLGNAKNWNSLVKRAKSGALQGINVLLRPISAESLENLTNAATSAFFTQETLQAVARLNTPPPGGFLITSDEGKQLVEHPLPAQPLNEYNTFDQWKELQRLSRILLQTPFQAHGVITNTFVDANGTRHIALHSEPDMVTLWRYLGTSLLLLTLTIIFGYNAWRLVQRWRKNQHRMADIHRYYQSCFNPQLTTISIRPVI